MRAVFLSDLHLGSRGCRAHEVLEFLTAFEADYLYLVGDIFDLESLRNEYHWPRQHEQVVRALFDKIDGGARVFFIPGNHDAELRALCGLTMENLEIHRDCVHVTADGRRLFVTHGDDFDHGVPCSAWLARLGLVLYDFILMLNRRCNTVRRKMGWPYWSLAGFLKNLFRTARDYIAGFERAVAGAARERGFDGVVCGHIHQARIARIDGVLYCNGGDWVENCTALVEDTSGRLSVCSAAQLRERHLKGSPGRRHGLITPWAAGS